MYLSVPLITLYLIFIGHLLTLLCGFSGPFISPLIGSRKGSGARASDEIRVCVVFNFQPCKFHALFAVCPAGTGGCFPPGEQWGLPRRALPPGAGMGRPGSFLRAGSGCLVHPLGTCGLGSGSAGLWEREGCGAGHGRHQAAVTVPAQRWPVPLPALPCALGTRGSGSSCPCSTQHTGTCAVPAAPHTQSPALGAAPAMALGRGSLGAPGAVSLQCSGNVPLSDSGPGFPRAGCSPELSLKGSSLQLASLVQVYWCALPRRGVGF